MTEPCEFCDSNENVRLIPFRSVLTFMCEKCVNESLNKARYGVTPNEITMETPRRIRLDLNTSAEMAITKAIEEVEKLGPDVRLTNSVIKLQEAKEQLSNYIDSQMAKVTFAQ